MGSQPNKAAAPLLLHQNENDQRKLNKEEFNELEQDNEDVTDEINFEDFIIVWLDENPIDSLLTSLNTVCRSFTDFDECFRYIKSIKFEFIFLIVGNIKLGRRVVPLKDQFRQLKSISILCTRQPELTNQWKGIKIFTDIESLIENLEIDLELTKNEMVRMRPIKSTEDLSFVWHCLFFQFLNDLDPPSAANKQRLFEQLKQFYKNDEQEKKIIEAFQRNYRSQYSLWWLTKKHKFLSRTLNKALRIKNYHFLCAYRFYLKDLYFQMTELKSKVSSMKLIVYRTQQISIKEIRKLPLGTLIVVETFLFTTVDYPKSDETIVEIHINDKTSHPYARLNERGDLVFFPMSVFRLDHLKEKFILLVMDQKTDREANQIINDAVKKYSLDVHSPTKMGLALWKLNIGTIQQVKINLKWQKQSKCVWFI